MCLHNIDSVSIMCKCICFIAEANCFWENKWREQLKFAIIFTTAEMAFLEYHLVILLMTVTICSATIQSVVTRFTVKKSVASSHTTLENISKIKCVERCSKERQNGMCTLAGYNKSTKTCYLSVDNPQSVLNTTDEMSGVFFFGMIKQFLYSLKDCICWKRDNVCYC